MSVGFNGLFSEQLLMNNTILLVTLEFPPCRSAGLQRPFRFAQYLQEMGWNPIILTATENVYEFYDNQLKVPSSLANNIFRAKAWNTTSLFSVKGKFPSIVTVPDRYWPWYFTAVRLGRKLIEQFQPSCIWSTYPVLTSHLVARTLQQGSKLPWIADFRDPLQCHYNDSYQEYNWAMRFLEKKIVKNASIVCTVTEEAARLYQQIYASEPANKFTVIENGYVPFERQSITVTDPRFVLLYSGALYGAVRDIKGVFRALAKLKTKGLIHNRNFVLRFRGSGSAEPHIETMQKLDIVDLVEFCPAVPFEQSIIEMQSSGANLLVQDELFRYQIPSKLYDYIQTRRPILAVCPKNTATANRCVVIPNCLLAWQDEEITNALIRLLQTKEFSQLDNETLLSFSRRARAVELDNLLKQLIKPAADCGPA